MKDETQRQNGASHQLQYNTNKLKHKIQKSQKEMINCETKLGLPKFPYALISAHSGQKLQAKNFEKKNLQ